jgi:hypothetical protein
MHPYHTLVLHFRYFQPLTGYQMIFFFHFFRIKFLKLFYLIFMLYV